MLGAIVGDVAGSRFEFSPTNDYGFELFTKSCSFTDDSICTIAIADALLKGEEYGQSIHTWCRKYPYPMGGYGGRFASWVRSETPKPYGSFGNGSAMRVSPVAWAFEDRKDVLEAARLTAECSHSHPEGIKGAQAVALATYLARKTQEERPLGKETIDGILEQVVSFSGYDIDLRLKDVQNVFDETCQGTVPVALWIIKQSTGFEDAVRKAVSLGADADTLGAIVGSIAEAIWGIPTDIKEAVLKFLPDEMQQVVESFRQRYVI